MLRSVLASICFSAVAAADFKVYVGPGGCDGDAPGCVDPGQDALNLIQVYDLDTAKRSLSFVENVTLGDQAVWLTTHRDCLYAALVATNKIASYKISSTGGLTPVAAVDTQGVNPVHITLMGDVLLTANYKGPDDGTNDTGAGVTSLMMGQECALSFADFVPHHGHSVIPSRQSCAHAHSVVADRVGGWVFACDLGQDLVFTYHVNQTDGKLTQVSTLAVPGGQGPRHTLVSRRHRILYLLTEMGSTMFVCAIANDGSLKILQQFSTLPAGFGNFSKAAEIVTSLDGRYIFASNRGFGEGSDSVAVFATKTDGTLQLKGIQAVDVHFPRGMEFSPDGRVLLTGGQISMDTAVWDVEYDGKLSRSQKFTGFVTPSTFSFFPDY